jgi:hypothetical protein
VIWRKSTQEMTLGKMEACETSLKETEKITGQEWNKY